MPPFSGAAAAAFPHLCTVVCISSIFSSRLPHEGSSGSNALVDVPSSCFKKTSQHTAGWALGAPITPEITHRHGLSPHVSRVSFPPRKCLGPGCAEGHSRRDSMPTDCPHACSPWPHRCRGPRPPGAAAARPTDLPGQQMGQGSSGLCFPQGGLIVALFTSHLGKF